MSFQPGQFQAFKAITKIHLGSIGQDIVPGAVIEYDGSSTRMNGQLYNIPSIGGAIRIGWLIPVADNISAYVPQPAGVQVRPATSAHQDRGAAMVIERATDDERQVGSLSDSNNRRDAALANQFSNNPPAPPPRQQFPVVREEEAPRAKYTVTHDELPVEINYDLSKKASAPATEFLDARHIVVDDSHNEGARPVARLRPANMGRLDISDPNKYRTEMNSLDPVMGTASKPIKVASTQDKTAAAEAARQARLAQVSRTNADAVGGTPIGQNHSTGATGDVASAITGDDLEDMLADAISTGKPKPGVALSSEEFTDGRVAWDKSLHWKARVKLAVEKYGKNKDALRQILEIEDEAVVKFIKAALAKAA